MGDRLLIIDEGTSSTRAMLLDAEGRCGTMAQRALTTHYPRPGWVEQDADEIWRLTLEVAQKAIGGDADRIAGIGLTNQRETIVFWDRMSAAALAPAIVWQDRRTADACALLREAGHEPQVQATTGLLLDPYFSATKIRWAIDYWPALRAAGNRLCVGTIDSWLLFKLTGGLHVSDATNASRTQLMDLRGGWDEGLCDLFGVPRSALPEIIDCTGAIAMTSAKHFGRPIPVTGVAGDQQAAAIGQGCFAVGETKATYGTGAFILSHAGEIVPVSPNRLLSTVAWQLSGERRYALEGSLFVAGQMLQWLRDDLGLAPRRRTMSDDENEEVGKRCPPIASRFKPGISGNPKGRPRGKRLKDPYEVIFGQMVTLRENGLERRVRADEAFLLQIAAKGLAGNDAMARAALKAIETDVSLQGRRREGMRIIFRAPTEPGNVRHGILDLGIAVLLDGYRPSARLGLETWTIEHALARLGDRQLTASEQHIVFAAARKPNQVCWPSWWSSCDGQGSGE